MMLRHSSKCGQAAGRSPEQRMQRAIATSIVRIVPRPLSRNAAVAVRTQATAQQTPTEVPAYTTQPAAADAAPEAVANVQQPYMQYSQQGVAARPEYYVAQPPVPPMYPAPPVYAKQETSSPIPWWVWMAAGILVANVARVVQDFMKKGPQQFMAEMAMKQMMKGMTPPGGAPGASPFGGAPGANPFGAGGASPFGAAGASPFGPYGAANPFAPNFQPPTAPVDTTATPVGGAAAAAAAPGATAVAPGASAADSSRGEKFASRMGSGQPTTTKDDQGGASSNGTAAATAGATAAAAAASPAFDVVEPEVKEPQSKKAASSFFQDVGGDSSSSNAGSSGSAGSTGEASQMASMMESMLRDPSLQKMLYPYLPEPMRNPDSIEWMLKTPEVRKQMEQMFAQSNMGMNPQMMEMMKQMDFSQDKVQEQFSQLGLKPEDVMQKVMSTPDLAAGFANPKVQQAIFDISQNPMNITKYQNDPEVMNVLNKVTEVFSPGMAGQPSK